MVLITRNGMDSSRLTQNAEHFDAIAGSIYDESIPEHIMRHLTRRRVNLVRRVLPAGRVLDVGCGTGRFLSALPSDVYQRFGIDVSSGMIRAAYHRDASLQCCVASGTDLPYADESFDVVFCAAVLHHIADPVAVKQTIMEIIRVLRRGGFAVIWDHNPLNPYWPLLMRRVPQDTGDERLIPRREIAAALSDISRMYPLNVRWRCMTFMPDFAPEWGLPVWRWMERTLEQIPLIRNLAAHNVALVYRLPT
jgi:ubiquinone/menaquinone biosynthesis C-methylase UbiE